MKPPDSCYMTIPSRDGVFLSDPLQLPPDWIDAYRRYYRFWLALARSSGLSVEDAEDIVHGVLCSAIEKSQRRFESLEHVRNYVARGVLNRAIQARQRSDRHVQLTEHHESRFSVKPDLLAPDQDRIHGLLYEAIRRLPDRDFEILKLRFYVGLTFNEISELLGVPMSTLKSREEAAVRKIRKWFRQNGI